VNRVAKRDGFLTNYASVVSAQGISTLANFLLIVIVSRHYGVEQFGVFTYMFALAELLYFLAEFGFPNVVVNEAPHFRYRPEFYASVFRLEMLFTGAALGCVLLMQLLMLHDVGQRVMAAAVAVYLLAQAPSRTLRSVFRSFERTRYEAVSTFVEKTLALAVAVAAAVFNLRMGVFAIGLALVGTINVVALVVLCRSYFVDVLKFAGTSQTLRAVLAAATPLGITSLFTIVNLRIGTVILEHYRNAVEVGLFGAAQRLITPLVYIVTTLQAAVMPILARRVIEENDAVRIALRWLLRWIAVTALVLVIVFEAFGRQLVSGVFGSAYLPAVAVLSVLIVSLPLTFLINIASLSLFLSRRYQYFTVAWGVSSVVTVLANLLLVPGYGALGVAYGVILSEAMLLGATLWFGREFLGSKAAVLLAIYSLSFLGAVLAVNARWRIPALLLLILCILPPQTRQVFRWLQHGAAEPSPDQLRSAEVGIITG
jgi:O-antigen/teichoic acid export membrane protein